jgi:hypothetical protein
VEAARSGCSGLDLYSPLLRRMKMMLMVPVAKAI